MTVHNFSDSLEKSKAQEDAAWWPVVYKKAFPGYVAAVSVRNDGWAQRGGIDRVITLKSGKTVTVDEKVRYESYNDILLERWSNKEKKTPGWIQKDLACDFIAYAVVPDECCDLLPFLQLRAAWNKYGREWVKDAERGSNEISLIHAQNEGYVTESIGVPVSTLMDALNDVQVVGWAA
jgi:hypothetical protein